jgi:hypothetical protein
VAAAVAQKKAIARHWEADFVFLDCLRAIEMGMEG